MRFAVLGAGAIGAYVGAALARGGADVHLIARGDNLEAMQREGVRVRSDRGDFEAHPPATDDPSEIGPVDFVFLGLKANSYAGCGPLLEPLLYEKTAVVAAQPSRGGTSTSSRARTRGAASRPWTPVGRCRA